MTVRTLILLRHAKAADPDDYATDIERPLSPRGRRDASAAGTWLHSAGLVPDAVLCSTAVRTRETLRELGLATVPAVFEQRIYHGPAPDTLDLVRQTDADVATLLVIGHNPTLSVLSDLLAPDELPDNGLATAGIAVHRFDGTWRDLNRAALSAQHTARG
ncbi:histidine phosphatase family protein [Dactylosporangium roseum]|uniref:Histidine phosphatase family protein n=1 Tax=Dactylosporangium roseum TaxID=47989 RepID=A0ABY5Z4B3_9ACTN|nr:histidine phosphatase family protein [Dactylosporangium roseum]UWZ36851.1 histidine phosphatase family protein [Dactylosporangium roseum]